MNFRQRWMCTFISFHLALLSYSLYTFLLLRLFSIPLSPTLHRARRGSWSLLLMNGGINQWCKSLLFMQVNSTLPCLPVRTLRRIKTSGVFTRAGVQSGTAACHVDCLRRVTAAPGEGGVIKDFMGISAEATAQRGACPVAPVECVEG